MRCAVLLVVLRIITCHCGIGDAMGQSIGIQGGLQTVQFRYKYEHQGPSGSSRGTLSDAWGYQLGAVMGFKGYADTTVMTIGIGLRQTVFHASGSGQFGPYEFIYDRYVRTTHLAVAITFDLLANSKYALQPGMQIGIPLFYHYSGYEYNASYQRVEQDGTVDVRGSGSPYGLMDVGFQLHLCRRLGSPRAHGGFISAGACLGITNFTNGEWKSAKPLCVQLIYGLWLKR